MPHFHHRTWNNFNHFLQFFKLSKQQVVLHLNIETLMYKCVICTFYESSVMMIDDVDSYTNSAVWEM